MTRTDHDTKNKKNKSPPAPYGCMVHRAASAASAGPHLSCPLGRSRLSAGERTQLNKKKNRQGEDLEEHAHGEDIPGDDPVKGQVRAGGQGGQAAAAVKGASSGGGQKASAGGRSRAGSGGGQG
jgi:hypothetical protein